MIVNMVMLMIWVLFLCWNENVESSVFGIFVVVMRKILSVIVSRISMLVLCSWW